MATSLRYDHHWLAWWVPLRSSSISPDIFSTIENDVRIDFCCFLFSNKYYGKLNVSIVRNIFYGSFITKMISDYMLFKTSLDWVVFITVFAIKPDILMNNLNMLSQFSFFFCKLFPTYWARIFDFFYIWIWSLRLLCAVSWYSHWLQGYLIFRCTDWTCFFRYIWRY